MKENQKLFVGKVDMSSQWTEREDSKRNYDYRGEPIVLFAESLNISFASLNVPTKQHPCLTLRGAKAEEAKPHCTLHCMNKVCNLKTPHEVKDTK